MGSCLDLASPIRGRIPQPLLQLLSTLPRIENLVAMHVRAKDIVLCVPALLQRVKLKAQNSLRVGFEDSVAWFWKTCAQPALDVQRQTII